MNSVCFCFIATDDGSGFASLNLEFFKTLLRELRTCPKTIRSYQNVRGSLQLFLRFGTDSDFLVSKKIYKIKSR